VALVEALCERLRVPVDCRDVARLAARFHGDMHRVEELRPDTKLTCSNAATRCAARSASN
jgi:tRNA nucleotidyltransferase (CCA-adding enzyme)